MLRAHHFVLLLALGACADGLDPDGGGRDGGGAAAGGSPGGAGGGDFSGTGGGVASCDHGVLRLYEPGPDAVLGTADDVLSAERTVWFHTPEQLLTRQTRYSGPGPDGAWDTADDAIAFDTRMLSHPDQTLHWVTYDGPGTNGLWGDDDDHALSVSWARLGANGRTAEARSYLGPGPDAQWMTADDAVARLRTFAHGDGVAAPRLIDIEFLGPGDDAIWGTGDDHAVGATRRFDDWGTTSSGPGADGVWGTADDPFSHRYEEKHDWEGYTLWFIEYVPGPDTRWFTPDDDPQVLVHSTCTDGVEDSRIVGGPGVDDVWGTPDDIVEARARIARCDGVCGGVPASPIEPK